jgi:putative transposase
VWIGKPCSTYLRERVIAAVEAGALSCHQAAAAVLPGHLHMVTRDAALASDRSVALGQIGGHKPKAISGEHRAWLLERARVGDFALRGLVAEFAESGLKVDHRAV